jgi:hypothetical protein
MDRQSIGTHAWQPPARYVPRPPQTERLPSSFGPDQTTRLPRAAPVAAAEPTWVKDTVGHIVSEIRLYLQTAVAFALRPRASAADWASGRLKTLNPLAYLLNSMVLVGPWRALWQNILGMPNLPLWRDVLGAAAPFIFVVVSGSLVHLFFRAFGSKRRLTSTWAVSIYATGGLPTIITLLCEPLNLRLQALSDQMSNTHHATMAEWMLFLKYDLGLMAASCVVGIIHAIALAGLHGTSRRKSVFILTLSTVTMVVGLTVLTGVFVFAYALAKLFLHR